MHLQTLPYHGNLCQWQCEFTFLPFRISQQQVFPSTKPWLHKQFHSTKDYHLKVDSRSCIELTFSDFELEESSNCKYDFLKVVDGSSFSNQLWKGCGSKKPGVLRSSGNRMTIYFRSDKSVNYRGFFALWKEKSCISWKVSKVKGISRLQSMFSIGLEKIVYCYRL